MTPRNLFIFLFLLLLSSCTPPVYEKISFDIQDFMNDSQQIAQGKLAILALEEHENCCCTWNNHELEERIREGDELSITLYCPQRPDRMEALEVMNARTGFQVQEGKIFLPQLCSIEVEGLTLNQTKEKIEEAYCKEFQNAKIFLNFKKRHERHVQIIGAHQAIISVDKGMCLSEVLARAGIHPYANLFKSYVMREGKQLPIDLYKLIHEGDESQNIILYGGDQIFIAHATDASIMVTGEVLYPVAIPVPYGFLSLREALVIAGGIPFTGNKSCIQVIRGELLRPKIYSMAFQEMIHFPNQSLLLMPGDIVVISEKPITQWNRFINQLQPSTTCMQTSNYIYEFIRKNH